MEDINQHFEQLRRLLVKIGYPHSIDKDRICAGITTELLPLLHYGLLSHSKALATFISDAGYSLYRQNDLKFTEGIYKLSRTEFKHNPILQCSQFLTDKGFAKRKIQFVVTILKLGINKHNQLIKQRKLSSQAKVSWKQTNLAKKVDKVIKNSKYQKLNNMESNANRKPPKITKKKLKVIPKPSPKPNIHPHSLKNNNIQSPPPKSIIPREIHVECPIDDDMEDMEQEMRTNDDSLTVDEIRNNLPEPVPITVTPTTTTITTQPQSISTQNGDTPTMESDNDDEDESDENKENEEEEKAMELTEDNQSIQIPQHQYDMQLIPEYDPNKYASPKLVEKVNVNGQNEIEMVTNDNNAGHYSASYLDAYSTMMDMPQSSDEEEEEEEQRHPVVKVINVNKNMNTNNTDKQQPSRPKIIVLSNRPKSSPQETGNENKDNDNDNKQQDEDEDDEDYEDNDEEQEHQHSDNDDDEEDDEEKGKDTNKNQENALLQQLKRMERSFNDKISKLESKVDSHVSLLNVRYKSLEDRITRLEQGGIIPTTTTAIPAAQPIATTSSGQSIGTNDPNYVPPATSDDIKRDSDTISALEPRQVPRKKFVPRQVDSGMRSQVSSVHRHIRPTIDSGNGNGSTIPSVPSNGSGSGGGWSETTVGSASIPVSYQGGVGVGVNRSQFVTDTTQNVIQSTIKTYPHSQQPRIATSPFLSGYQRPAMGMGMRTGISPVPNIHSPSVTLSNQSNGAVYGGGSGMGAGTGVGAGVMDDNPDNTMQFIQDLKKMLSQTDELLKSNRERTGRQY